MRDLSVYANMYKRRFTAVLPINFRHELMIDVSGYIYDLVDPLVGLLEFEDGGEGAQGISKE